MFLMGDPLIETLMVIGYNPSHSNINSEVNAPFKMLSLMLRFLENESKPAKQRPLRQPVDDYDPDQPDAGGNARSAFGGYKMNKQKENDERELEMDSGARIDTMNDDGDDYNSYGSDGDVGGRKFGDLAEEDRLSVDLNDLPSDDEGELTDPDEAPTNDRSGAGEGPASGGKKGDDMEEETKAEGSDHSSDGKVHSTGSSSGDGSAKLGSSAEKLFAVGESNDRGLADIETGSEVYMSELLVSGHPNLLC